MTAAMRPFPNEIGMELMNETRRTDSSVAVCAERACVLHAHRPGPANHQSTGPKPDSTIEPAYIKSASVVARATTMVFVVLGACAPAFSPI